MKLPTHSSKQMGHVCGPLSNEMSSLAGLLQGVLIALLLPVGHVNDAASVGMLVSSSGLFDHQTAVGSAMLKPK